MIYINGRKEASSDQNSVQETPGKGNAAKYRVSVYARLKSPCDCYHAT